VNRAIRSAREYSMTKTERIAHSRASTCGRSVQTKAAVELQASKHDDGDAGSIAWMRIAEQQIESRQV